MQRLRMVPLVRVGDGFEARVLAARLGADGFVTQLRGSGIDGTYPFGAVEVLVSESDLPVAQELLLADEVESAFDNDDDGHLALPRIRPWLAMTMLVLVALASVARVLTLGG